MENKKLLIGVVIVIGGLTALIVVRSNAQKNAQVSAEEIELRPEFVVQDDEPGFRSYKDSDMRQELMLAVQTQVKFGESEQLAQLAVERADMLFDTDFDTWEAYVEVSSGEKLSSWSAIDRARFQEIWDASIAPYRNAKLDLENVQVRDIDPDRGFPDNQPGTLTVRSNANLTAPYRKLTAPVGSDHREVVEVLIPVQVADKAGAGMGATIGFVLGRERPSESWRELDMFIYAGNNGFGRKIVLPPF